MISWQGMAEKVLHNCVTAITSTGIMAGNGRDKLW